MCREQLIISSTWELLTFESTVCLSHRPYTTELKVKNADLEVGK